MDIKNIILIVGVTVSGFIALLLNENSIDENWMVHCLSCIG
tara:strand:+ start:337 stop:459 length:123 start_codon:yes stop_codon:yes gene_type:complete